MFTRSSLILASAAVLSMGCSDRITKPNETAEIRLLQITPGLGPVTLEVDGEAKITGVMYGTASPRVVVPGGDRTITLKAGSTLLGTVNRNLDATQLNSVVLANGQPQFSTLVETDTGAVSPASANIRMVVVATENTDSPTDLQALFTWSGSPPDSIVKFGVDATVARYGSLMYFQPGTFTFKYVEKDTETPVLAETTFDVAAGEAKAVVLSREDDGSYTLEVVTETGN